MAPAPTLAVDGENEKPKVIFKSQDEGANGNSQETKELVCENNFEDNGFHAGTSCVRDKVSDAFYQEIDVLERDDAVVESLKVEDQDATEYSSSFGETFSGSDHEMKLNSSDMEVDSQFSAENCDKPVSDGGRLFKKKKVNAHWRRLISPIMWRCRWLEVQMNELHSQALLYDKELAGYKQEKQLQSKMIELNDSVSRSVPLTGRTHKKQVMKRKKRKRNEERVDVVSYMSNHNIFSYYENKRDETDGHSYDDDCCNQVTEIMNGTEDHELSALGFSSGDHSLEHILSEIEALQSRRLKLKTHLSKVMCKISRDAYLAASNFLQDDPPTSYDQNHCSSPGSNGDTVPANHISEYQLEEVVVPECAVSSYGEAADLDIIKSTMGLLSGGDSPQQKMGVLCKEEVADDVLIDNQAADEELQNFEKANQGREKPQEPVKKEAQSCSEGESTSPKVSIVEPTSEKENADVPQKPVLKPCYTGKKRGRKPKKRPKMRRTG